MLYNIIYKNDNIAHKIIRNRVVFRVIFTTHCLLIIERNSDLLITVLMVYIGVRHFLLVISL